MCFTHHLLALEITLQRRVVFKYSKCEVYHIRVVIIKFHVQGKECGTTGNRTSDGKRVATYIPNVRNNFSFN
jgi:hypothetical protein